jgi:hypothetical protein
MERVFVLVVEDPTIHRTYDKMCGFVERVERILCNSASCSISTVSTRFNASSFEERTMKLLQHTSMVNDAYRQVVHRE